MSEALLLEGGEAAARTGRDGVSRVYYRKICGRAARYAWSTHLDAIEDRQHVLRIDLRRRHIPIEISMRWRD